MSNDNVTKLIQPGEFDYQLTEIVAKTRSRCDIQRRDRGHRQADRPSAHNRRRLTGPGRHQNLA
jgi:hypothetical protein